MIAMKKKKQSDIQWLEKLSVYLYIYFYLNLQIKLIDAHRFKKKKSDLSPQI